MFMKVWPTTHARGDREGQAWQASLPNLVGNILTGIDILIYFMIKFPWIPWLFTYKMQTSQVENEGVSSLVRIGGRHETSWFSAVGQKTKTTRNRRFSSFFLLPRGFPNIASLHKIVLWGMHVCSRSVSVAKKCASQKGAGQPWVVQPVHSHPMEATWSHPHKGVTGSFLLKMKSYEKWQLLWTWSAASGSHLWT